ncbi:DNA polymerase III subunit chi [Catenovulum sp. 2E275]|uniref:DNA polymerase III subunit chi n=1 Tax=Catenovulum sp. 2E275 TaxID=2980497 RepID=UPI0021D3766E|nr:DNA polymerase III subunit chi [Catenovulum sp. 2E275]MCU4677502.1 DNA polymerase III subunit chi [Catenovulum sp. 2E275]
MSQITFYLLPDNTAESSDSAVVLFACKLVAKLYRDKHKVFVYTDTQAQAEAIDEMLWQFDATQFVAHNLQGEGPSYGSPVEISWQAPTNRRSVLVNLSQQVPTFSNQFQQIFDFVPAADKAKQQARERYKAFRQAGHSLSTSPAQIA